MNRPKPSANKDNSVIWPELWSAFESHRHKICQLLTNLSKGPDSRLCVLGSGRTTDLDLIELLKYFSTIDLVDLDPNLTTEALVQRGFDQHPAVINGCSQLFLDVFGQDKGVGTRSAFGVSGLPGNAAVEIEGVFILK